MKTQMRVLIAVALAGASASEIQKSLSPEVKQQPVAAHGKRSAEVAADGSILKETAHHTADATSKQSAEVAADGSILKETAHHTAAATSMQSAEVAADGTVRRSSGTIAAHEAVSATKNEAVRSAPAAHSHEAKTRKGKQAVRADKQISSEESNVGPGGEHPYNVPPSYDFPVPAGDASAAKPLEKVQQPVEPDHFSWNWMFAIVAVVLFALTFYKSKEQKRPAWQECGFIDSFLAQQYDLRREVAVAEGWDKHFPPKDVPNSLCHGICYMDRLPSRKYMEQAANELVKNAPRFGAALSKDGKLWEPTKVDLNYHIVEHGTVSSKRARDDLMQALLHKEASLDTTKPLWRFHIVPCKVDDSLLIFSFSHAIGDAVSVVPACLSAFGAKQDGKPVEFVPEDVKKAFAARAPGKIATYIYKVGRFFKALPYMGEALQPPEALPDETRLPCHNSERWLEKPFSGPLSMTHANQRLLNFPPFPIKYVKDLKNKAKLKEGLEQCTVNDVLFEAYMGMLRRYCEDIGKGATKCEELGKGSYTSDGHEAILEAGKVVKDMLLRGCQIHNTAAMAKLAMGEPLEVRNGFEFYQGNIGDAFGAATPEERLKLVVDAFQKDKKSGRPDAASMANVLIPYAVKDMKEVVPILMAQQTKVTFTLSAMAFSPDLVYADGCAIKEIRGCYHSNIPTVTAVSYGENIAMGVNICAAALPGWERWPSMLMDELKALGEALGVDPEPLNNIKC